MAVHKIKKLSIMMDQSLVTSTKQKSLIKKISIKYYLCWLLPFHYCEPGAELFKQKWAATSGRVIYLDLQEAMLHCLKATNSKFTLIHDLWKTKGNHFGLVASVSFIDHDWELSCWQSQQSMNVLEKHGLQIKISINSTLFKKHSKKHS
ncbi:hypothetical protein VP01_496g11 [Puccinia sorghi]|uniref:Uncharacterized protein n=1 Tax=Puccinia sorghi TaxID=27349 RepID=A0A0L6UMN0_9BASI|nr:hypothetical protein VP01_496g11 [Puccinia sorghi]